MCPELSALKDGSVQLSSGISVTGHQPLETVATYVCHEGFVIDGGDHNRICSSIGTSTIGIWTGRAPTCLSKFPNYYCDYSDKISKIK